MSAALQLRVFREGRELETVALNGELVVGRAEGCALRLQDQKISRKHLVLIPSQGGVRAESRSEFSPVRVNGREVSSAQLVPGDSIELGPFLIKLEDSGGASTPNREMIHSQGVPHLSSGVSASVAPVDRRGSGVSLASPPENSLSLDPTGSQEASEAALPETGEESPLELGQQEENSLAVSSEVDGSSESDQSGPVGTGLDGGLDGGPRSGEVTLSTLAEVIFRMMVKHGLPRRFDSPLSS